MSINELPDMQDSEGKVRLTFIWDTESHYEDEEEDEQCDHEEEYTADTWQEACDEAAMLYHKDGEQVMNFDAESELVEINHDLKGIYQAHIPEVLFEEFGRHGYYHHEDWQEVTSEVYEYYARAEEKAMGF